MVLGKSFVAAFRSVSLEFLWRMFIVVGRKSCWLRNKSGLPSFRTGKHAHAAFLRLFYIKVSQSLSTFQHPLYIGIKEELSVFELATG